MGIELYPKFLSLAETRCYQPLCESIVAKCCQDMVLNFSGNPTPKHDKSCQEGKKLSRRASEERGYKFFSIPQLALGPLGRGSYSL